MTKMVVLAMLAWLAPALALAQQPPEQFNASASPAVSPNLGQDPSVCDDMARTQQIEAQLGATARAFPLAASGTVEGSIARSLETSGISKQTGYCTGDPNMVVEFIDNSKLPALNKAIDEYFAANGGGAQPPLIASNPDLKPMTPQYDGAPSSGGKAVTLKPAKPTLDTGTPGPGPTTLGPDGKLYGDAKGEGSQPYTVGAQQSGAAAAPLTYNRTGSCNVTIKGQKRALDIQVLSSHTPKDGVFPLSFAMSESDVATIYGKLISANVFQCTKVVLKDGTTVTPKNATTQLH